MNKLYADRNGVLIDSTKQDKGKTVEFAVSDPDNYKVGGYVDMIFYRIGSNSHKLQKGVLSKKGRYDISQPWSNCVGKMVSLPNLKKNGCGANGDIPDFKPIIFRW